MTFCSRPSTLRGEVQVRNHPNRISQRLSIQRVVAERRVGWAPHLARVDLAQLGRGQFR